MAEAIAIYNRGLELQSSANQSLGQIQQLIAENNATAAAEKLKTAITGATLTFDQTMLGAINDGIWQLVKLQGGEAEGMSLGGIVYASNGQMINFQKKGTDTVPAMLTPGEFVMSRYAVNNHGVDNMKALNNGESIGDSVYNYSISVNVKSDANPDEIARAVMAQIKQVDSKKLRGARL